jgi:hypothetical protein
MYFSYRHQLNHTYTVKPCGILKGKNALITSVYSVTAYTIYSRVISFSTYALSQEPPKPPIQCTRGALFLDSKDQSVKVVNHYYIFIARCLFQKKIAFDFSMHCIILHYSQATTPIFLWSFAAIYLFMTCCITCFLCCFFLPSPIICLLLFSFVYLFQALSICLKCPFFDKCIYFLFSTRLFVCTRVGTLIVATLL